MSAPFQPGSSSMQSGVSLLALFLVACPGTLVADESAVPRTSEVRVAAAKTLLEEALICEVDGRDEDRKVLLAKAAALDPDLPAIQWQRGMILVDGEWTPAEEVAATSENRALVEEYVTKRDAADDSLAGQLKLAKWCQEKKLFPQERAHLARALRFDPNHANARARLGFVRVGDEWISREEIARSSAETAKVQASIKKHAGSLYDVIRSLGDDNPAVRKRGFERVRVLRDAEMIPTLETLVAPVGEEATLAVLDAFAAMPEKEASLSLARFATFSPSERIRAAATALLKGRKYDHYVPEMLATMLGSIEGASFSLERRGDARLVYRQMFYRKGHRSDELIVNDLVYANSQPSLFVTQFGFAPDYVRRGGFDDQSVVISAQSDSTIRSVFAEIAVADENANARLFNARLTETLTAITGEDLGPDAEAWWNWWDQYNELSRSGGEQVAVRYSQSSQSVGYERFPNRPRISAAGQRQSVISCFAAGTPVLTNRGDVAIEQVRVGDLVLAQDVESGELAFKPVLETTVRPPVEILRLEHEGGSLRTTGGHPFWVSGEGWVHARRLQSGMELHTPNGTVRVSQVVSDGEEPAYNLIVADFANYFVGESRVLCHDNSSRLPTDAIVPGLAQD